MSETTAQDKKNERTVTPLGWSRAELSRLEPEFGARLEALVQAVERPRCRVRPASQTGTTSDAVRVLVLGAAGEPMPVEAAHAAVEAAARACGLTVAKLEDGSLSITLAQIVAPEAVQPQAAATVSEAEEAAPAKGKRR